MKYILELLANLRFDEDLHIRSRNLLNLINNKNFILPLSLLALFIVTIFLTSKIILSISKEALFIGGVPTILIMGFLMILLFLLITYDTFISYGFFIANVLDPYTELKDITLGNVFSSIFSSFGINLSSNDSKNLIGLIRNEYKEIIERITGRLSKYTVKFKKKYLFNYLNKLKKNITDVGRSITTYVRDDILRGLLLRKDFDSFFEKYLILIKIICWRLPMMIIKKIIFNIRQSFLKLINVPIRIFIYLYKMLRHFFANPLECLASLVKLFVDSWKQFFRNLGLMLRNIVIFPLIILLLPIFIIVGGIAIIGWLIWIILKNLQFFTSFFIGILSFCSSILASIKEKDSRSIAAISLLISIFLLAPFFPRLAQTPFGLYGKHIEEFLIILLAVSVVWLGQLLVQKTQQIAGFLFMIALGLVTSSMYGAMVIFTVYILFLSFTTNRLTKIVHFIAIYLIVRFVPPEYGIYVQSLFLTLLALTDYEGKLQFSEIYALALGGKYKTLYLNVAASKKRGQEVELTRTKFFV